MIFWYSAHQFYIRYVHLPLPDDLNGQQNSMKINSIDQRIKIGQFSDTLLHTRTFTQYTYSFDKWLGWPKTFSFKVSALIKVLPLNTDLHYYSLSSRLVWFSYGRSLELSNSIRLGLTHPNRIWLIGEPARNIRGGKNKNLMNNFKNNTVYYVLVNN